VWKSLHHHPSSILVALMSTQLSARRKELKDTEKLLKTLAQPQLPKLGNVNKRAQLIIASHMHTSSVPDSLASTSTMIVPVLSQIDSTAPKTSKTHDISHRCDQGAFLRPKITDSMIQESDHVFETSFMPKDATSVYSEADGLWHTKVFPSHAPSSRQDAVLLDAWITKALEHHAQKAEVYARDDLARVVEELVPILSVALHEIVRQVMHQCVERGVVLQKIWKTYVELFDRVLHQMQESLRVQKDRTSQVTEVFQTARKDVSKLRKEHPEQMHTIIADLESKFTERQVQFEEELNDAEAHNSELKEMLRDHHKEIELWYPHFGLYQDSYVKNHVPQLTSSRRAKKKAVGSKELPDVGGNPEAQAEEEVPPEVAIAEDFKRLLAVLAPEKRKMIGKEIAPVMDAKNSQQEQPEFERTVSKKKSRLSTIATEEQAQRETLATVDKMQHEVHEQEAYIKKLRHDIAAWEAKIKVQNEIADGGEVEGEKRASKEASGEQNEAGTSASGNKVEVAANGAPTAATETDSNPKVDADADGEAVREGG